MAVINSQIDSGIITATFTDMEGHVFSRFRINPADLGTANRFMESQEFFNSVRERLDKSEDAYQVQSEVEEKISYVLGYSATEEIFGELHAFNILPSGDYFMMVIVDKIGEILEVATPQRQTAAKKRAAELQKKYRGKS
jgi:hypothetical protein